MDHPSLGLVVVQPAPILDQQGGDDLDLMIARERSQKLEKVVGEIEYIRELMEETSVYINSQGEEVDQADALIYESAEDLVKTNETLAQASRSQWWKRKLVTAAIGVGSVGAVVAGIFLVTKTSNKE